MSETPKPERWDTIKVFGSAIVRVVPDAASIVVAVSCLEQQPEAAFAAARRGAQSVNAYLHARGLRDVGSSRITLAQEFRYTANEQRFAGYRARIAYSIHLRELDRLEETLTGLIAAGANELTSVKFETTRLKEIRADARRRAVAAAREKAELYCAAAGAAAGRVSGIEDVNPDLLTGRFEGHARREVAVDDAGDSGAMDPAAIVVGAAVHVIYQIEHRA